MFLDVNRPAPIATLARELGLDPGGLTREADRLERAGLVRSERMGRQRILRPDTDSPYYANLHGLLLTAFGPASRVGPALMLVEGVEDAFLFGSWAARYKGEPGPDPADIDVLVVGTPSRAAVARVARDLSEDLGREVDVTIVTRQRWREPREAFIREVKRGPLVPISAPARSFDGVRSRSPS